MYTTGVEFDNGQHMWRVTLYKAGIWQREDWFFNELVARQWAAEVEAGG